MAQLHTPVVTPITVSKKTSSNYVSAVPEYGAGLRRVSVGWFRNNEGLAMTTSRDSLAVLPVCCFDLRDSGKSFSGFDKTTGLPLPGDIPPPGVCQPAQWIGAHYVL